VEVAQRHPEWLHAYIGVGQLADGPEGERRGWRFAMDSARRAGNAEAVRQLEALAPYAASGKPLSIEDIYAERKWVEYYGGTMAYRHDNAAEGDLAKLSPDYTDEESRRAWEGNKFATPVLLPEILSRDLGVKKLDCPLILFEGRHDTNINAEVAAEWFAKVKAPEKHIVWFEHSAHLPMTGAAPLNISRECLYGSNLLNRYGFTLRGAVLGLNLNRPPFALLWQRLLEALL
jgi:pimeloyl-ACP methyl ester carboxylesterase